MINNKWFCSPDNYRESWCFLIFDNKKVKNTIEIQSWNLGYGNPHQLIKLKTSKGKQERKVINDLLQELNYCRKNHLRIITLYENDVKILRTRCIQLQIQDASLQKINYMSLEGIIQTYFTFDYKKDESIFNQIANILNIKEKDESKPEQFRKILNKIGPLLPRGVF